jgi:CHASE3 domain sensor protein
MTTVDDLVVELYALTEDPAEAHNLAREREALVTQMLPVLLQIMASQREASEGASENVMTPAQVKQIQQQGYWGLVDDGKLPP